MLTNDIVSFEQLGPDLDFVCYSHIFSSAEHAQDEL